MTIKHKPRPLAITTDQTEKYIQRERNKNNCLVGINIEKQYEKLYSLIWGQCCSALQVTIKGISKYDDKADDYDVIWLLTEIKKAISGKKI